MESLFKKALLNRDSSTATTNFEKFLRTPILKNTYEWLVLLISSRSENEIKTIYIF